MLYLVEAASGRVLLTGLELLKLCIQDVHQLLHEPHAGADVASKHRAVSVARQFIGQVRRVLSTPDLLQFRAKKCVITRDTNYMVDLMQGTGRESERTMLINFAAQIGVGE